MTDLPAFSLDPVALAQALMRCPSVTPQEAGVLSVLEQALAPYGFSARRLRYDGHNSPAVDNLFCRWGQQGPHFAFAGHVDVVPAGDAQAWTHDPFAAALADGVLYGRGACDMKTGVAAFAAAAATFTRQHPDAGQISLLITCDEEGPSVNGTEPLLAQLNREGVRFDACMVGEPTSYEHFGDMAKIGRRGSLHGLLTVKGKQGHVAYPERADNPIPRLLRLLAALDAAVLDNGSPDFQPSNLEIVTVDVGNPVSNLIPAKASAKFNVRFNTLHTAASLSDRVRAICAATGEPFELTFSIGAHPFLTASGPLSSSLCEAVREVTGQVPKLSTTGGTSDARFVSQYCPVVEFGVLGATAHQVDEHIAVAEVTQLAAVYLKLLERWFASHG